MLKFKKIDVKDLKILCFDEADYFFKEQSDTAEFTAFTTEIKGKVEYVQFLFFSATYSEEAMCAIKGIV